MLNRDEDILKAAEDWQKAGHGVALATVVETWGSAPRPAGSSLVINDDGTFLGSVSGGCVEGAVVTEALDVIASGQPKMHEFGGAAETAWNVGMSCGGTIRVFVVALHISQAPAPLARSLDCDVTVVDPRTAFASPERFPDVALIAEWPDVALPPLNVDHYTAFVAVTHDPKIDDPALKHAFERDCFYIGALGSRKTHAKRGERLKAQGADDADIARIRAPIGLPIGAVSPSEIAVAIMAEITAQLRLPKEAAA